MIAILVKYIFLFLLLGFAVAGDLMNYRIYNLPVVLGAAAGLAVNTISEGLTGFISSLIALSIPFLLLFALYALRMLGAGDIKLFCAIGAIMGMKFILYTMVYSFLTGGIIAIGILLVKGNSKERFGYIVSYLKTCFLTRTLHDYTDFNNKSDGAKFHFSLAIAAGTLIQAIFSYSF